MPNEPVIVHRSVCWQAVYEEEYLPDLEWWGTTHALSRSRWTALREDGLTRLSIEYFGAKDDMVTPERQLSLRERAKHSNFGKCNECEAVKVAWESLRRSAKSYTIAEVADIKRDLFRHLHEMRAERRKAMSLHQECVGRSDWLFEYDDKCGSQYTHLPSPKGGRETAASSGLYKYRTAVQANLYANGLMRLSLVPP
eukprot:6203667-Pleurochrysis_carterae.AAC.1